MPTDSAKPLQFSLRAVFGVMMLVALVVLVATGGIWGGLPGALIAIYLIAVAATLRWWQLRAFFSLLIVGCVVAMILPPSHGVSPLSECRNNLRQIALALNQYHDQYGSFPPAYIADKNGRPMHSWRVLILPFLDQPGVYSQYNFNEPWDGPRNRKLIDMAIDVFQCPADDSSNRQAGMTSYVVVAGPGTMFGDGAAPRQDDVTDDPSTTIMVVEVSDSGIHWMEPRDLDVTQTAPAINLGQGIRSRHAGGATVAFADGSVRFPPENMVPETLRALLTPNGGEQINSDDL